MTLEAVDVNTDVQHKGIQEKGNGELQRLLESESWRQALL